LQHAGVPIWCHNLASAKPVSGAQFVTPVW
jgi:hypothetical protein